VLTKKPSDKPDEAPPIGALDLSVVEALAEIAAAKDLSEVEVEREGLRIRVARERQPIAMNHFVAAPSPAAADPAAATASAAEPPLSPAESPGAVKSPMVGTAYLRPSPEAKPFVEVGAAVKAGDKIMLVEAMKTFNEIVAPRAGTVTHVLVEDGAPVEYGQALMVIE
jgi:acetyl-CoA carboxylase biotin carboxyl carrier protein